jgi:Zn-finger nucleic acid-binding protein
MKCPIDDTVLQMTDRQGIEIGYCPQCRGVWLDRGELDKLIDRSAEESSPSRPAPRDDSRTTYDQQRRSTYPPQDYDERRRDSGHYKKRKKESFLGEMFDF